MKSLYLALFLILLKLSGHAQNSNANTFLKTNDVFGTQVFVENKGQFDGSLPSKEKILFAYQNGEEQIYFTEKGLVYKFIKARKLTEEEIEEQIEHTSGKVFKPKAQYLNMQWQNANTNIQVIAEQKQSWYFTYGAAKLNASGYKKIIYKNVYNNIDIEYTIPEKEEQGIKYTVIMHPEADPNDIQIAYSGPIKTFRKIGDDIVIAVANHTIIEHAPYSFYKNGTFLPSNFVLNNGLIGFNFPAKINSTEEVHIDPWVSTLPTLTSNNMGFDVDFDNAGNLYVYGGGSANMAAACKIAKYSATGTLLWTFQMILPAINWNTAGLNGIPGNFTVNKTTQKVYAAETFVGKIVRLDINGNYDNFMTPATNAWSEIWEMGYNSCTGEVYAFGGGTSFNKHAAIINETNATAVPVNLSGFTQTNQDMLCHAFDESGTLFTAFTVPSTNTAVTTNYLLRANQAFNSNTWVQLSTYNSFVEYSNKPFFTGTAPSVLVPSSNGFNCLAVNNNFLFYYDGFNIAAYNKLSGVKIGTITIPGYTALYQGGIAVDNCNNVYVGGNGFIHVFSFNGTTFTALPNIPLGVNPVTRVYDIRLNKASNTLFVSGNKFVGTYSTSAVCLNTDQVAVTYTCGPDGNAVAIASVTTSAANPQISYTWTGSSGIVSQTPNASTQNTVSNLSNGNYTVTVQINAPCGPTYSTSVTINCPVCSVAAAGSVACIAAGYGFSLSVVNAINFSTPPTYLWTGPTGYTASTSTTTFTNGAFGVYTLTANGSSCSATASVLLAAPPNVSLSISASPSIACVGQSVLLSGTASGGVSPYAYQWSAGPATATQVVIMTSTGNFSHSLTVLDAANCKASKSLVLSVNPLPTVSVNNATVCENSAVQLQANGADSYVWLPGAVTGNPISPVVTASSSYTVIGSTKGCSSQAIAQVSVLPAPVIAINPFQHSGCVPLCIRLSSQTTLAGVQYVWYSNNTVIGTGSAAAQCYTATGQYKIILRATDEKNCKSASPVEVVSVFPKPLANFTFNADAKMPIAQVNFTNTSRVNITDYYWYFGDGNESTDKDPSHVFPEAAVYQTFLVVKDENGCADTVTKAIKILDAPALYIPNTFTPNGDGLNDNFFVKGSGVRDFKMRIYNRWGQKLFETNDIFTWWDGSYKGSIVEEGTYTWQIIYTPIGQHTETITGHVNLIR